MQDLALIYNYKNSTVHIYITHLIMAVQKGEPGVQKIRDLFCVPKQSDL